MTLTPDTTLTIEELPLINSSGVEYGIAWCAEIDVSFEDDGRACVWEIRFLGRGDNAHKIRSDRACGLSAAYEKMLNKRYHATVWNAWEEWRQGMAARRWDAEIAKRKGAAILG